MLAREAIDEGASHNDDARDSFCRLYLIAVCWLDAYVAMLGSSYLPFARSSTLHL